MIDDGTRSKVFLSATTGDLGSIAERFGEALRFLDWIRGYPNRPDHDDADAGFARGPTVDVAWRRVAPDALWTNAR
jgi:hypothetical protein